MSQNYRDICEIGEDQGRDGATGSGNPEEESQAPSTPFDNFGNSNLPGSTSTTDLDELISSPNQDLSRNLTSSDLEITRGSISEASRKATMIPQQFVYNFPRIASASGAQRFRDFASGVRDISRFDDPDVQQGRNLAGKFIPPPSKVLSDYIISGPLKESVVAVIDKQDPIRFTTGKIYYAPTNSDGRPSQRSQLADLYNNIGGPEDETIRELFESTDTFDLLNTASLFNARLLLEEPNRMIGNLFLNPRIYIQPFHVRTFGGRLSRSGQQVFDGLSQDHYMSIALTKRQIDLAFSHLQSDITIEEVEDYLFSNLPDPEKMFGGGKLVFKSAFFKSEMPFIERSSEHGLPSAEVKINFPKNPMATVLNYSTILELDDGGYYQEESQSRADKISVYRDFLNFEEAPALPFFREPGENGAEIPTGVMVENENCVVVEKFSSHRVNLMQEMNALLEQFTEPNNLDESRLRFIDNISPLYTKIEFTKPALNEFDGPINQLNSMIVDHNLDSFLLAFLDFAFSSDHAGFLGSTEQEDGTYKPNTINLFDSPYAYNLEQNFFDFETKNEDDFYSGNGPTYYSPNEKILFNYRPRVIKDIVEKMNLFLADDENLLLSEQPDEERERFEKSRRIRKLFSSLPEYPLLFENCQNLVSENDGVLSYVRNIEQEKLMFDTLRQSMIDFEFALYEMLFPNRSPDYMYIPRDLDAIFEFQPKSCILAFRIEKVNAFNGKVLKEFYLYNNPDIIDFKFIDSEVFPSEKYRYNIYAINFVADCQYKYPDTNTGSNRETVGGKSRKKGYEENPNGRSIRNPGEPNEAWPDAGPARERYPGRRGCPTVRFRVKTFPCFKIIESPFFSQEVLILDRPPIQPDVSLDKLGRDPEGMQEFRIRFTPGSGDIIEEPIPVVDSDLETIQEMKTSQMFTVPIGTPEGHIEYSSDTNAEFFEVFILREEPSGIESFSTAAHYEFPATMPFFTFAAPINEPRYMIFRAKDRGGISNPTKIYKFLFNSYGDGEYYEFDLFEPELQEFRQALVMTCERYLSIEPSVEQSSFNFGIDRESTPAEIRNLLQDNPPTMLESADLGIVDDADKIWNRKFKIRLKSTNTGRSIDFNIEFLKTMLNIVPEGQNEQSAREFRNEGCEISPSRKNTSIKQTVKRSDDLISKSIGLDSDSSDNY